MEEFRSHMNPPPFTICSSKSLPSFGSTSLSSCRPSQSILKAFCPPIPTQVLQFELGPDGLPLPCKFDQPKTLDVSSVRISDMGDGVGSQFLEYPLSHDADADYQQQVVLRRTDETEFVQSPSPEEEMEIVSSWLYPSVDENIDDIFGPQLPPLNDQAPDLNTASPLGVGNRSATLTQFEASLSQYNVMPVEDAFTSGSTSTLRSPYGKISTSFPGGNHARESILSPTDTAYSSQLGAGLSSPPRNYSGLPSYIDAVGTVILPGVHEGNDEHEHGDILQFHVKSELLNLNDGYIWRKYGQKKIKNREFPRSYFRCAQTGCNVQKQLERSSEKQECVLVTYIGKHNHPA